jgi:formate dehydrogenase subunit delta
MSESGHDTGSGEHLVAMANDIGNYFRVQDRQEAIAGIASHIKRYWTPRMQQKLAAFLAGGAHGLDELPRAAFATLNVSPKKPA